MALISQMSCHHGPPEKMATGSVDNGLQESFHGLRVKGEACVWCGGVSGWLRWDEVKLVGDGEQQNKKFSELR